MKHQLLSTFLILAPFCGVIAQKSGQTDFELGLSAGVTWYNGDLNPRSHFNKQYMHTAMGLSLRRNLNQRFALRSQFIKGRLSADDAWAKSTFQRNRNLNFSTELYELSVTVEFNYLVFDALIDKHRFSPYTFIGLGGFYFNPVTYIEGNVYELHPLATEGHTYSRINVSMPFGIGIKAAISDRIMVSAEWGMRSTLTDYIDDVSTSYPLQGELEGLAEDISDRSLVQHGPDGSNWGTQRGNSVNTDWFSFAGVTLAVRLGPKKGSCKHLRI